jgi:hypothetical protein
MPIAYVIYDSNRNLYYSRYPNGWTDNLGHAKWYSTRHESEREAKFHGGRVLRVGRDFGLDSVS